jgi:uncharacterized protein (DUF1778 family)
MHNFVDTADTRIGFEVREAYGYYPYKALEVFSMSKLNETLNAPKTARLELKTTDFAKDFIRKAAMLSGQDMTSFIIASAFEKAEAVMERHQRIELSAQGFSRLHEVLAVEESVEPTRQLKDLMRGTSADRSA